MALDDIDAQLLRQLRRDARLPVVALAERLGISRPAVHTRLNRLMSELTITGSSVRIDHRKVGLDVTAILSVSVRQPARDDLIPCLRAIPLVQWAGFVSGETDLLVLVRAGSIDQLRDEIVWQLQRHPSVRATRTQLVLSEVIDRPFLLPTDEPERPAAPDASTRRRRKR